MKPPRPFLNVEMIEDRLLPSSMALLDSSAMAPIAPNGTDLSPWHQQNAGTNLNSNSGQTPSPLVLDTQQNFDSNTTIQLNNSFADRGSDSFSNPITAGNLNQQAFNNSGVLNDYSGEPTRIIWNDTPINSTFVTQLLVQDSSNENFALNQTFSAQSMPVLFVINLGFNEIRSVSDGLDGRLPPWTSRDGEPDSTDPLNGIIVPGPFPLKNLTLVQSDLLSSSTEYTANLSTGPETATASAPGLLLVSLSPQSPNGMPIGSEQSSTTESHLSSEMSLAAVSLMNSPGMTALPALQPMMTAYLATSTAPVLPTTSLTSTTLNLKAHAPARLAELSSDLSTPLAPIDVNVPAGAPLAGVVNLDEMALDERVSRVLASITAFGAEFTQDLEKPDTNTWLIAAGLLSAGAGYAVWANRKTQRIARIVFRRKSLGSWEGAL